MTTQPTAANGPLPLQPEWASATQVLYLFGLSRYQLETLGIRSIKLGTANQSRRLYNVEHIRETLIALRDADEEGGSDDA